MSLILVADAAYPFDYSKLPTDVVAVAGYLGGDTPHIWTASEIATLEATGREWWGIWTAPSRGQVIPNGQGVKDGYATVAALKAMSYDRSKPVAYDVEYANWVSSPSAAMAAIRAWKLIVRGAGWLKAIAYVPYTADFDWVAYWDNILPTSLPNDWVGQQYGGYPGFDLSAFNPSMLGDSMTTLNDADATLVARKVWSWIISPGGIPDPDIDASHILVAARNYAKAANTFTQTELDAIAADVVAKLGSAPAGTLSKQDVIDILNSTSLKA